MEYIGVVVAIIVIYYFIRKASHKEAKEYIAENSEPRAAENLENVDTISEVIVEFVYLRRQYNDLMNSFPNIVINKTEKYKLVDDHITIKLPVKFNLHFGVPYMKGEAFKINLSYNLKAGRKYRISFKPPTLVFSKPKVTVEETGTI
jgi:hypothetical protein